jgi:hypothetical protein
VLDSGADLAKVRVEFALPVFQFCAANPLERRDRDAVDPYIP